MTRPCTPLCKLVFNLFDEDRDGKITPTQLQNCIELIGCQLSAQEAEMVVMPLISNHDELVGLNEFANLVESSERDERMEDLKKAFAMYTMEGECITPKSLKRVLDNGNDRFGEWNLDECTTMIKQFDLDGDGVLCFQEFQHMMLLDD